MLQGKWHLNQRKVTVPWTNFHFYFFNPTYWLIIAFPTVYSECRYYVMIHGYEEGLLLLPGKGIRRLSICQDMFHAKLHFIFLYSWHFKLMGTLQLMTLSRNMESALRHKTIALFIKCLANNWLFKKGLQIIANFCQFLSFGF